MGAGGGLSVDARAWQLRVGKQQCVRDQLAEATKFRAARPAELGAIELTRGGPAGSVADVRFDACALSSLQRLALIHIAEPTRQAEISYAVL